MEVKSSTGSGSEDRDHGGVQVRSASHGGRFHEASFGTVAATVGSMDDPLQGGRKDNGIDFPEYALGFLRNDHPVRSLFIEMVRSRYFEQAVLVLIIANCISLGFVSNRPNFDQTRTGKALELLEYVFLCLFTMEMVAKIIAMGFAVYPGTYLRDGWNRMDFAVVVLGWLAFIPSFGNYSIVRVVRVFRPLRTITRSKGMRVLVIALLKALPMLMDVMILCGFAFFIFGIAGVQLFAGLLRHRCGYPVDVTEVSLSNVTYMIPESEEDDACSGRMAEGVTWSVVNGEILANGGSRGLGRPCPSESIEYPHGMFCVESSNPNYGITNFDNILWAWLTIFQCISMEGWTSIMYKIQDSYSSWAWVYFTILIVFGSFFTVNLALAVLYLHFVNSGDEEDLRESDLRDEDYAPDESQCAEKRGDTDEEHQAMLPRIREFCYRLQLKPWFEGLTMVVIILNTLMMASESHEMPRTQEKIAELTNVIFTVYFTIEMMVKIVGLNIKGYLEDKMNMFDGVVVLGSLVEILVSAIPSARGMGVSLSILRTFRLMRIFKLARSWKELNKLINTIFQSLKSIAHLSLILLLFIFIAALLGMQLFGFQFQRCDYASGSQAVCPPGLDPLRDCPPHFDCYVECNSSQHKEWISAPGSFYNNLAYCEKFPRSEPDEVNSVQYFAQVGRSNVPRHNFDDLFRSIITIFQILTGEDWNSVMYEGMRSTSNFAAVYFISLVVVGNYIILNLFLAILLDNFGGVSETNSTKKDSEAAVQENTILPILSGIQLTGNSLNETWSQDVVDAEPKTSAVDAQNLKSESICAKSEDSDYCILQLAYQTGVLEGTSLCFIEHDSWLRVHLSMVVGHRYFEHVIIALICLSSITLAVDSPGLKEDSSVKQVLNILDIAFVVVFALEAILKIIVSGFVFNGENSYLRNPWNALDFVVVVVGIILSLGKGSNGLASLRVLRTLRALRPIRMASRNEGMKVVVNALFQSIPPLLNVLLVCMLFFLIFGILGIDLLKGSYHYCADQSTGTRLDAFYLLPAGAAIDKTWCEQLSHNITSSAYHSKIGVEVPSYLVQHRWVNKDVNFDNIGAAMMALFEMATLEMWLSIMYDGVDAVGVDKQPVLNNNPYISIFFVIFIIVGAFFILNLIVGVIIDKFNEIHQTQDGKSLLLTSEQEQWLQIQRLLSTVKPIPQYKPPSCTFRRRVFMIVVSQWFDAVVMGMILINIAFLSMAHANMSQEWTRTLFVASVVFTGFFLIEGAAKLFAFGVRTYFQDAWNIFDFWVVLLSAVGIGVDVFTDEQIPVVSLLRVFRVARMFRLIPKAKGLRTLFQTLLYSLPALANVGSVLFLFFFIFAIMGMNLFGQMRHGEFLNRQANFENFPKSLMLLFRMATGESWNGIMHDCMQRTDCILITHNVTIANGTFIEAGSFLSAGDSALEEISKSSILDQCGPPYAVVALYFAVFVVMCAFILLNLLIAVILDNFQSSSQSEEMLVGRRHLLQFAEVWSKLDPTASGFIPTVELSALMLELDPPLGLHGSSEEPAAAQKNIMSVDIPNRENRVQFLETLHALAGRVAGTQLPEEDERQIHERLCSHLPQALGFPKYTAAHVFAALYVQAAVRGFLARHQMTHGDELVTNIDSCKTPKQPTAQAPEQPCSESGRFQDWMWKLARYFSGCLQGRGKVGVAQSMS